MTIFSDFCTCVNAELNVLVDQLENRANQALRDLTRLDARLKNAPLVLQIDPLETLRDQLEDAEKGIIDAVNDTFQVPEGSAFGGVVRCLRQQVNGIIFGLLDAIDITGLIPSFSFFIRGNILQDLVDKLLPQIDAQINICANPLQGAIFQGRIGNALGSIGADSLGNIQIENLTNRVIADIGAPYKAAFDSAVNCVNRVFDTAKNIPSAVQDTTNKFSTAAEFIGLS